MKIWKSFFLAAVLTPNHAFACPARVSLEEMREVAEIVVVGTFEASSQEAWIIRGEGTGDDVRVDQPLGVSKFVGRRGLFYLSPQEGGSRRIFSWLELPDDPSIDLVPLTTGEWTAEYLWQVYSYLPDHSGRGAVLASLLPIASEAELTDAAIGDDTMLAIWAIEGLVERRCTTAACVDVFDDAIRSTVPHKQIAAAGALSSFDPDMRHSLEALLIGSDDTAVRTSAIHRMGLNCDVVTGDLLVASLSLARTPIERASIGEAVKSCPSTVRDTAAQEWTGQNGSRIALWAAGITEPEHSVENFGAPQ